MDLRLPRQNSDMRANCTASAACQSVVPTYIMVELMLQWPKACLTRARLRT